MSRYAPLKLIKFLRMCVNLKMFRCVTLQPPKIASLRVGESCQFWFVLALWPLLWPCKMAWHGAVHFIQIATLCDGSGSVNLQVSTCKILHYASIQASTFLFWLSQSLAHNLTGSTTIRLLANTGFLASALYPTLPPKSQRRPSYRCLTLLILDFQTSSLFAYIIVYLIEEGERHRRHSMMSFNVAVRVRPELSVAE